MKVQVFDDEGKSHTYGSDDPTWHLANPGEWAFEAVDYRRVNVGGSLLLTSFGAYGDVHIVVWAKSVEDALELAAEYAKERGWDGIVQELDDVEDEADIDPDIDGGSQEWIDALNEYIDANYLYTESGYITSHEWWVNDVTDKQPWLEVLYASIMADPDATESDLGQAIAAGLTQGDDSLAKKYGRLLADLDDEDVSVEVDAAMGA